MNQFTSKLLSPKYSPITLPFKINDIPRKPNIDKANMNGRLLPNGLSQRSLISYFFLIKPK